MSQARTIYGYLTRTDNQAADAALLLGWARAEEPYRTALLEVMLDRATNTITLELIRRYHTFNEQWQGILQRRIEALYGGLYPAGRDAGTQTRLNCLTLIKQTRYRRAADLVCGMLRDRNEEVGRLAGSTLLELVRTYIRENPVAEEVGEEEFEEEEAEEQDTDRAGLKAAVKRAVDGFEVHGRYEAVLAGMCLVRADDQGFWQEKLAGFEPVGQVVREVLLNYGWDDLAGFCLSALRVGELWTTALRAIAEQERGGFVGAVAKLIGREGDEVVRRNLRTIAKARWLEGKQWLRSGFSEEEQLGLIDLVGCLGAAEAEKAAYLVRVAKDGSEAAGLKAVARLGEMKGEAARQGLVELLEWDREAAALAAAWRLLTTEAVGLERIMVGQMQSRHESVRRLAWGYYRGVAFKRYWENFERLGRKVQVVGGRAVFKLDRQAEAKWREKARDESAQQRLRAVQVARVLGRPTGWGEEVKRLVKDEDRRVRSCAVAGLGEQPRADESVADLLRGALKDEDDRVRANAVEALEQRGWRDAGWMMVLAGDENNRVRANAIKALLTARVQAGRRAVQEMLNDRRARHRRSARWVVETLREGWEAETENRGEEEVEINYQKSGGAVVLR